MSTHTFTINVPNPSPRAAITALRLEPATARDIRGMGVEVPRAKLRIDRAGLALDPCAEGKETLRVRLDPYASVDVHVTVVTRAPANAAAGGAVAVNLIDQRGRNVAGGALLVCVDPPLLEPAGQLVQTPKPCPVDLAGPVHWVDPGEDPTTAGRGAIPVGATMDLVVPLASTAARALADVTAYLEHLGPTDTTFAPAVWNMGTLRRGDIFYASWTVTAGGTLPGGTFEGSIVVESPGRDRTRIVFPVQIARGDL